MELNIPKHVVEHAALKTADKKYVDDNAGSDGSDHDIVDHDTDTTGAELTSLVDNSMADALHRHSELSASDGTPDQAVFVDVNGNVTIDGALGIGKAPAVPLDVNGNVTIDGNIIVTGTVDGIDIATDVAANTLKDTNVTTNLSLGAVDATTMVVASSDGTDVTLIEADTTDAGLLGSDKWDEIVANSVHTADVTGADHSDIVTAVGLNTAKDTNVTTNITVAEAPTNVEIQSSDGSNDTIAAVDVTNAGVMTTTMYDEHVVNTAKDTYVKTNIKGHVAHGATAATARATGFTSVEWVGSVEPTNAVNGDTWIDTT